MLPLGGNTLGVGAPTGPEPETKLQLPVPCEGVLPMRKTEVALHNVWSFPALAVVETVILTTSFVQHTGLALSHHLNVITSVPEYPGVGVYVNVLSIFKFVKSIVPFAGPETHEMVSGSPAGELSPLLKLIVLIAPLQAKTVSL
jgi:hypothetical protein